MKPVEGTIAELLVGVTGNQKSAIINLVLGVASCDAPANEAELDLLQTYLDILGVPTLRQALAQLDATDTPGMLKELALLSNKQKELVVLLVNNMICVDGPANESEFTLATYLFDLIGLPVENYVTLVEQANRQT
ncbi:hypothetical protein [Spirosoma linguale]|uniref:Co-chaperone DjlA N-terminal domain-containing protein n=1 Tax=Spirosoma linguale (strain ATCC 33905 / DSM 74 / LMG 10896 / Claus 1) TaxID=504472 RepID=D2QVB1_SPILD|nr:hypothetical protein Slin_6793 [Spirosoma linguale DSM 74]